MTELWQALGKLTGTAVPARWAFAALKRACLSLIRNQESRRKYLQTSHGCSSPGLKISKTRPPDKRATVRLTDAGWGQKKFAFPSSWADVMRALLTGESPIWPRRDCAWGTFSRFLGGKREKYKERPEERSKGLNLRQMRLNPLLPINL